MVVYRGKNVRIVSMSQYLWTWLYIYNFLFFIHHLPTWSLWITSFMFKIGKLYTHIPDYIHTYQTDTHTYTPPYFSRFTRYPWEISSGNTGLAFTVMLMILSSIFLLDPMKLIICKTNRMYSLISKNWMASYFSLLNSEKKQVLIIDQKLLHVLPI